MTVAIDLDAEVAGEAGTVRVLDPAVAAQCQPLALDGERDALLGIQQGRMAELQIGGIPGQQLWIGQACAGIGRGMTGYLDGGLDGGADRSGTEVRG